MKIGMMDVHTRNGSVVRVEVNPSSSTLMFFSPGKERVISVELQDGELEDLERIVSWAVGMRDL